jgi:cytochrome P450
VQKWDSRIETQLCYELKTFLLAGHETSAAMLMWSVYELSRNPGARDKVRQMQGAKHRELGLIACFNETGCGGLRWCLCM